MPLIVEDVPLQCLLVSTALSFPNSDSTAIGLNPAKPGVYGIGLPLPPQKPVMFAPNVTPGTYVEPEDGPDSIESLSSSSTFSLHRRLCQLYLGVAVHRLESACPLVIYPRPPNAFMLFRADFVRQKHVPGSIETNHGSLSKIIGGKF